MLMLLLTSFQSYKQKVVINTIHFFKYIKCLFYIIVTAYYSTSKNKIITTYDKQSFFIVFQSISTNETQFQH